MFLGLNDCLERDLRASSDVDRDDLVGRSDDGAKEAVKLAQHKRRSRTRRADADDDCGLGIIILLVMVVYR